MDVQRYASRSACGYSCQRETSQRVEQRWYLSNRRWQGQRITFVLGQIRTSATARGAAAEQLSAPFSEPREMSGLSPESAPKRTLIRSLSPFAILRVHALYSVI